MKITPTLIKWPGGKSKEYKHISSLIPKYDRYIEPFFGGGAVFLNLKPNTAIINDICEELVEFYRFLKGGEGKDAFRICLYDYVDNWEKIPKYIEIFEEDLIFLYNDFRDEKKTHVEVKEIITKKLKEKEENFNGLFSKDFCLDPDNLLKEIIKNLISKINRTKAIEKERGVLPEGDLHKNIETAFRSGFYMHFRGVMNQCGNKYEISQAKKISNYYFIREFCYASMFRFNSKGDFNIPYGGIGYNDKNFRSKVDYIFSQQVENYFKGAKISNTDFENIFKENEFDTSDFIFLDPPYDTDFSDYEKACFDKKDQERLANCLYATKAKFILVIKKTPYIFELYNNKKGIKIDSFEKTYLYNVKGRNNRDVEHLVIYNF